MSTHATAAGPEIALEEWTPRGPFSCADFFLAETVPTPRLLLMDGAGVPSGNDRRPARVRFSEAVLAAWPEMQGGAAEALAMLGRHLRAAGEGDAEAALYAAAAFCVQRPGEAAWEVAESGDTRVFLNGRPVHAAPLAFEEHRLTGPLGHAEPVIRVCVVPVAPGDTLSLMTDGAWRLLIRRGHLNPKAPHLPASALEDFSRWRYEADDDATFARCTIRTP